MQEMSPCFDFITIWLPWWLRQNCKQSVFVQLHHSLYANEICQSSATLQIKKKLSLVFYIVCIVEPTSLLSSHIIHGLKYEMSILPPGLGNDSVV